MKKFKFLHPKFYLFIVFIFLTFLSILIVHVRVEIALISYEIGRLKNEETQLIQKKNMLTMRLSKILSKDHLQTASSYPE